MYWFSGQKFQNIMQNQSKFFIFIAIKIYKGE